MQLFFVGSNEKEKKEKEKKKRKMLTLLLRLHYKLLRLEAGLKASGVHGVSLVFGFSLIQALAFVCLVFVLVCCFFFFSSSSTSSSSSCSANILSACCAVQRCFKKKKEKESAGCFYLEYLHGEKKRKMLLML